MGFDIKIAANAFKGFTKTVGALEKTGAEIKSSEQASSIFKGNTFGTNTLPMDAKATLAKLNIGPITANTAKTSAITPNLSKLGGVKPKSEYQLFEEAMISEIKASNTKILKEKLLREINPINSTNIERIKSELEYFTKDLEPTLKEEISSCNDPAKLFDLVKKNFIEITSGQSNKKSANLMKKAVESGITPELENEYNSLLSGSIAEVKKMINIFTPKSTNAEVLKIEEEVRKLGVTDVNFFDDLDQAKLVKEALEDMTKGNIPLPHSITVTPMIPLNCGGLTFNEVSGLERRGHVLLKTSTERKISDEVGLDLHRMVESTDIFKNASQEYQNKVLNAIDDIRANYQSTLNSKHVVYHETAHTFEPSTLASKIKLLTKEEMETAGEISQYAKHLPNGVETMPEMFAKLMDGQTLTDKQMALYLRLGGIVPQF